MSELHRKLTDHCTRCRARFQQDVVAFMVSEKVVWQILGNSESGYLAITDMEIVPICSACLTAEESTRSDWVEIISGGCVRKMMVQKGWRGFCSARCAARVRRARRRIKARRCIVCLKSFQTPRKDAKFCSNACRQHAYRLRSIASGGLENVPASSLASHLVQKSLLPEHHEHEREARNFVRLSQILIFPNNSHSSCFYSSDGRD